MRIYPPLLSALMLLVPVLFAATHAIPAGADDDINQDQAQALRKQGVILPLENILDIARRQRHGRVMEVELEKSHGRYVYEIEIVDDNGKVWELKVDASDGSMISREQEN
ncbi:MAG: PepSY domain-containing protein [Gammaproteobacteria bacterium]